MDRKLLASRLTNFYVLLYGVFVAALVVGGIALRTGVLHGPAPFALRVVPAIFGGVAIVVALIAAGLPADLGQRVASRVREHERVAKLAGRAADALATLAAGVRGALTLARARDPALVGALFWWAFDIAVLWACFKAFGESPPGGVVVMGYLTGTLGKRRSAAGRPGRSGGRDDRRLPGLRRRSGAGRGRHARLPGVRVWLPIVPACSPTCGCCARSGTGTTARSRKACDDGSRCPGAELRSTRKSRPGRALRAPVDDLA